MHRRPDGSEFPSLSGFHGEQPLKRRRIQELDTAASTGGNFQKLKQDVMDDDEWEELDENAMDECMVLATQMCSQIMQNQDETITQKNSHYCETAGTKSGNNISSSNYLHTKNQTHNIPEPFTRSSLSDSRPIHNKIKSSKTCGEQINASKNSYSSRFTDFSIPSNCSQKVPSTMGKPVHGSGKVYNSIPMKGNGGSVSSAKVCGQPSNTTRRLGSDENASELLKKIQEEKAKFEEEVILKQGEISLLRLEMKRKDAALEAERLDRCAAIEAAEKRGKEKVANIAAEAESKTKESMKMVEKLKGELHFKNREVEELVNRCRQLEQKTRQCPSSITGTPPKRGRTEIASPSISPGKGRLNFMSRFDFGGGPASVQSVEVQTESSHQQAKRRQQLNVTACRGRVSASRHTAYLLSASASVSSEERQTDASCCTVRNWNLPYEWSYLTSQILIENDSLDMEKKLVALAIERLQEVHTMIISREAETNWCEKKSPVISPSPVDWYESRVGPALHVLWSFASSRKSSPDRVALQVTSKHLSPLYIKEAVVNNRIRCIILETLERVAKTTLPPLDKVMCEQMIMPLTECCASADSGIEVLAVLKLLLALSPHIALTSQMCTATGSCLVGKLCSGIGKLCKTGITTVTPLIDLITCLVKEPPPWLQSSCSCSSQLLATLLKQIYKLLDFSDVERGYKKTAVYKLLLSSVRVLHCWSIVDSGWWEKVAYLPHYTALMGAFIANAKEIQPDKQTVDLLCDLYEFDEGTFDSSEKS